MNNLRTDGRPVADADSGRHGRRGLELEACARRLQARANDVMNYLLENADIGEGAGA